MFTHLATLPRTLHYYYCYNIYATTIWLSYVNIVRSHLCISTRPQREDPDYAIEASNALSLACCIYTMSVSVYRTVLCTSTVCQ